MNTLPSSSLTIPPWPVRAPQKHRAGTRGPGAAPSSRSGAVRSPLVPELQADVAASDVPRPGEQALDPVTGPPEGVGEDQAPRPASPRPEMGCLEGCPVQMRLSRRRGNDLGPPHLLFLQSPGRWARTPACSGAVHGARLCRPLREEQCQPRPTSAWLGRGPAPWSGQAPGLHGARSPLPCPRPAAAACEEPGVGAGVHAWCSVHHHSSPACPPALSTVYKKLILQRTGTSPLDTGWHLPADHWVGLHT